MLKNGEEWTIQKDDELPMLVIKTLNGTRVPTSDELERAASYLNDHNSYSATIYCRNDKCSAKGSWIRRAVDDLKRNTYCCEVCQQPMVR